MAMRRLAAVLLMVGVGAVALWGYWREAPPPLITDVTSLDPMDVRPVAGSAIAPMQPVQAVRVVIEDELAAGCARLRVLGENPSGQTVLLQGVEVRPVELPARWRAADAPAVGRTDASGCLLVSPDQFEGVRALGLSKAGYVSTMLAVSGIEPGSEYIVTMQRGFEFRASVRDPQGRAVPGATIRLSRKTILTEGVQADMTGLVPAADPTQAVYHAVADESGDVVIGDLAPGFYFCQAKHDGMFDVCKDQTACELPTKFVREFVLADIYAAVVRPVGDEVVAHSATWPTAPVTSALGRRTLSMVEEQLKEKFPGALAVVGVPSLATQKAGPILKLDLACYGRTSGWQSVPIRFEPLRRAVLQEVPLAGTASELCARAKCEIANVDDWPPIGDVVALISSGVPLVHKIIRMVGGDGRESLRAPVGDYEVFATSPFVAIVEDRQIVSLQAGQAVTLRGSARFPVAEVRPRIKLQDGDVVSCCSLIVKDVESGLRYSTDSFADGDRLIVPIGRRVDVGVRVSGAEFVKIEVLIDRDSLRDNEGVVEWVVPNI